MAKAVLRLTAKVFSFALRDGGYLTHFCAENNRCCICDVRILNWLLSAGRRINGLFPSVIPVWNDLRPSPVAFTDQPTLADAWALNESSTQSPKALRAAIMVCFPVWKAAYPWMAFIPGRTLPSRSSSIAPPPVETKLTLLARPAWLMADTESPPPIRL